MSTLEHCLGSFRDQHQNLYRLRYPMDCFSYTWCEIERMCNMPCVSKLQLHFLLPVHNILSFPLLLFSGAGILPMGDVQCIMRRGWGYHNAVFQVRTHEVGSLSHHGLLCWMFRGCFESRRQQMLRTSTLRHHNPRPNPVQRAALSQGPGGLLCCQLHMCQRSV